MNERWAAEKALAVAAATRLLERLGQGSPWKIVHGRMDDGVEKRYTVETPSGRLRFSRRPVEPTYGGPPQRHDTTLIVEDAAGEQIGFCQEGFTADHPVVVAFDAVADAWAKQRQAKGDALLDDLTLG